MSTLFAGLAATLLACDSCKLGLSQDEQQAMRYTIYLLLALIYSLGGAIVFYVVRMMRREARQAKAKISPEAAAPASR